MERVEYNKLSKELRAELDWDKPLKPSEKVQFELLGKGPMVQKVAKLGSNRYEMVPSFRPSVRIPPTDIIYDPYKDNGPGMELGGNVDIGVPIQWDSEKQKWLFESIEFTKGSKNVITISGMEPHKRHIINYLRASNMCRSNRNAIPPRGTGFLFEEIKTAAKAKERIKFEREKKMAIDHILQMSEADAAMNCKVLGLGVKPSMEENLEQLLSLASTPSGVNKFLGQSNDNRTPVLYTIKKAVDLDKIRFEDVSRVWSYADTKKQICQVTPGSDPYEHLMDYFFNTKIGETHKVFLESEIDKLSSDQKNNDAKKAVEKITNTKGKKDEVPVAGD